MLSIKPSFGIVLPHMTDAGAKELAAVGAAATANLLAALNSNTAKVLAGAAAVLAVAALIGATGWSASTVLRAVRDGGVKVVELDVTHRDVTAPLQPAGAAAPGGGRRPGA